MWEVPIWVLQTNDYPLNAYAMDPGGDIFALLKLNFDNVGAPLGCAGSEAADSELHIAC
jgi:hypothetical protein